MARSRNIKPSLFKNELLGVADPLLTILFISLWCLADKRGRLEDRPLRIKAETFPYREGIDINGYLTELSRLGFIQRYKGDGINTIQIINFEKHQNPHHTEKESDLKEFSIESYSCDLTVKDTLNNGYTPADSLLLIPDSLIPDSLIPDSLIPDSINTDSLIPDIGAKKNAPKQTGKALDKNWVLPKAWGEWALLERPEFNADDIRKIADIFKDHWLSNSNQAKSKKADWEATWRNWVRNQKINYQSKTKFQQIQENNRKAGEEFLKDFDDNFVEKDVYYD